MNLLDPGDIETAALLANSLADVAGNESSVIQRLMTLADDIGLDATRDALVRLAVVTFAHYLTPHTPGTTVSTVIPKETS